MSDNKEYLERLFELTGGRRSSPFANSWERVEEIRTEILTDTDNYPWRAGCEELWSLVSDVQNNAYLTLDRDERPADNPIRAFIYWLEIPMYPPIEVLRAIAEGFEVYLNAQGKLTLEEVFFGPPKKGVGNHAARVAKTSIYREFEFFMRLEALKTKKSGGKPLDLESGASKYLSQGKLVVDLGELGLGSNHECDEDPESFLRNYRRWKEKGKPVS